MPHSPFTRILGWMIVAGYALALLWPDDRAQVWGWNVMFSLPILIGIFTWSAVRGAPPFDDNAFHRTLPPGDGVAFRRVMLIHLALVGGIALSVLIYCTIHNFGWRPLSYGIVVLTITVWAWIAANGVAASLSTSRGFGVTWGYLSIYLIPIFSAYWFRSGFEREPVEGMFYITPMRLMVIAAALIYPLIWWLVAAKRQWRLGLMLGVAAGFFMPVIYLQGGFLEVDDTYYTGMTKKIPKPDSASSHVTVSRKAVAAPSGDWLAAEELLEITGLREGEFFSAGENVTVRIDKIFSESSWVKGDFSLTTWELPENPSDIENLRPRPIVAGNIGMGRLGWGERSIWEYLRNQLGEVESLGYGRPMMKRTVGPSIAMKENQADELLEKGNIKDMLRASRHFSESDLSTTTWTTRGAGVFRFEKAGEIEGDKGGFCRLPGGGSIRFDPVKLEGDALSIRAIRLFPNLTMTAGPWFGSEPNKLAELNQIWVIAVDKSARHAIALNDFWGGASERIFLGRSHQHLFEVSMHDGPEQVEIVNHLRNCRLHIFSPVWVGALPSVIPPPQ